MAESASILVVDDHPLNLDTIKHRLEREGHIVITAADGMAGLKVLQEIAVDLVLLDIMMPGIDGYEVLKRIKASEALRHIPVVMVSALDEQEMIVRCIEAGADDYLLKPVNTVLLRARVNSSLSNKRLHDVQQRYRQELEASNDRLHAQVQQQVQQITAAQTATILAMSKLAESKDPQTGAHLERLQLFCRVLAIDMAALTKYDRVITTDFIHCLHAASPLHDIGKVGIPDKILLKPGKLTDNEWEIMRTHTHIGADTLRAVAIRYPNNSFLQMGIEIAESHHEKWDGSGYPHALRGESIPLAARILALADVYDALTSERCYKHAFSHEESRSIILAGTGKHFDPDVVQAFVNCETDFIAIKQRYLEEQAPVAASIANIYS